MTDWLTPRQRSRNMASIRSKGNKTTELLFARVLRVAGISGWRRHQDIPGKPDFVFRDERLAVFIDGCFWHGCPRCYRLPQDNRAYWSQKVISNRRRDRLSVQRLKQNGWKVLRVWEHALEGEKDRRRVLERLSRVLSAATPA